MHRAHTIALVLLGGVLFAMGAAAGCAAGTRDLGGGSGGSGGGATSATTGSGSSTSASATTTGGGGMGPCHSAPECASLTDDCNAGTCINGVCMAVPVADGTACDDKTPCTDAVCMTGVCTGTPKSCPGSDSCHVGGCDPKTEMCTDTLITMCMDGDGCCPGGCDFTMDKDCAPPTSFNVLATADVTYMGIDYLVLQVSLLSATSVASDWCYEYLNLCQGYGYLPTGCGPSFNTGGYGTCKTTYMSDGTSDTLGCNPSGGVSAAAQMAGFGDATGDNSFGFHYCDASTCQKTMCTGDYCNTALSYIDMTKPHGYTLCKK